MIENRKSILRGHHSKGGNLCHDQILQVGFIMQETTKTTILNGGHDKIEVRKTLQFQRRRPCKLPDIIVKKKWNWFFWKN
ncbi:hypothetical protein NE619_17265 [Anaerovorax odorimutans]|uniref:Uncharacterized protein n=1 Tax=Anaerovorax odorimutans TaxID=109327 RepID=A0ABT1RTD8_9FIRM|nr:hypothetical protein [Anaerovorax odorimutans]